MDRSSRSNGRRNGNDPNKFLWIYRNYIYINNWWSRTNRRGNFSNYNHYTIRNRNLFISLGKL